MARYKQRYDSDPKVNTAFRGGGDDCCCKRYVGALRFVCECGDHQCPDLRPNRPEVKQEG